MAGFRRRLRRRSSRHILRAMTERPDKPLTVRVIRWEGLEGFGWGVDVDRGNGKHDAYPVGAQEAAEAEAKRIRSGHRLDA